MGGLCPVFGGGHTCQTKPTAPNPNLDLKSSERAITTIPRSKSAEDGRQATVTLTQRKNNLNQSTNSTRTAKVQRMSKKDSITQSSSVLERKNSSLLFQGCIFESSSIIIKNSKDSSPGLKKQDQNCYVLIDNVFLIKKSMDCIKVVSPHSESQLNCPINNIPSTYYLTQGLPLDSIKEVSTGKIIQTSESPIMTKLKLVCKNCEQKCTKSVASKTSKGSTTKARQVKMTFSTSLIHPREITCDQCQHKGEWRLISIESNFPIWGNGKKIEKDEVLESLPSTIRVMGCISCLKYTESEVLPCGCYMCKNCYAENSDGKECRLCEAIC